MGGDWLRADVLKHNAVAARVTRNHGLRSPHQKNHMTVLQRLDPRKGSISLNMPNLWGETVP